MSWSNCTNSTHWKKKVFVSLISSFKEQWIQFLSFLYIWQNKAGKNSILRPFEWKQWKLVCLTNCLLWLGRCENPYECFWIPERNAWPWRFACLLVWWGQLGSSTGLMWGRLHGPKYTRELQSSRRMLMFRNLQECVFWREVTPSCSLLLILAELQVG